MSAGATRSLKACFLCLFSIATWTMLLGASWADDTGDALELLKLAVKCPISNREIDSTRAESTGRLKETRTATFTGNDETFRVYFIKKQVELDPGLYPLFVIRETLKANISDIEISSPKPSILSLVCLSNKKCITSELVEINVFAFCNYDYEECVKNMTPPITRQTLRKTNIRLCDEVSANNAATALEFLIGRQ
ncbi:hypothetical protein [Mesorhizobium sp. M0323]|uniref:hypothetical protein n=1 Tax=Mesorhizobium sp. M0323 TaxID=2956938 RepID=UPI003337B016